MSKVVPLHSKHPLVGTWRHPGEDETVEYTVAPSADGFIVTGVDTHDGEAFAISNVSWDGAVLRFTSLMPSTEWELEHEFTVLSGSEVSHTFTRREVWQRVR